MRAPPGFPDKYCGHTLRFENKCPRSIREAVPN
jgi:hypothetical protein